jgi:hypothetical protein
MEVQNKKRYGVRLQPPSKKFPSKGESMFDLNTTLTRIAVTLLIVLGLCAGAVAQTQDALPDGQTWPCQLENETGVLRYQNGTFYLKLDDMDDPAPNSNSTWMIAGVINGYQPGRAGMYVGDLDGTGHTSVAFFDAYQSMWYHGTFSGYQLTFRPVAGEVFHVSDQVFLFPVLDRDETSRPNNDKAAGPHAMANAISTGVQPAFPIVAQQYTKLATSRSMKTTLSIFADGFLSAVTQVNNGVWLAGYHGGVQVTLLDGSGRPLWSYAAPRIGVTGTLFGKPNVTVGWTTQVPTNILTSVREIAIFQLWDPDFTTIIRDLTPWLNVIQTLAQIIKLLPIPGVK